MQRHVTQYVNVMKDDGCYRAVYGKVFKMAATNTDNDSTISGWE